MIVESFLLLFDILIFYNIVFFTHFLEDFLKVKCFGAEFLYGFEYISAFEPIVLTPFSDRCMTSILLALHQHQTPCLFGRPNTSTSCISSNISKVLQYY